MKAIRRPVVCSLFAVAFVATEACNSSSGSTPPTTNPPSAAQIAQQDAANGGAGGASTAGGANGTPSNGSLNSLFGSTGGGSTPATIRSSEKTELQSEVDQLESELATDVQNVAALQGELNGVEGKGIPTAADGSVAGSLATAALSGAAGAVGLFTQGGSSSGPTPTPSGSSGSTFNLSYGASTALTGVAGALGSAVSTAITEQQTTQDVTAIGGSVEQEIDALNDDIKNLNTQINQKNAQIDALNVQGTD